MSAEEGSESAVGFASGLAVARIANVGVVLPGLSLSLVRSLPRSVRIHLSLHILLAPSIHLFIQLKLTLFTI